MTPPGAIYEVAAQHAAALAAGQQAAADQALTSWAQAYGRTRIDLDGLFAKIAKAKAEGQEVSLAWLYQQDRYQETLRTAKREMAKHAENASRTTLQAQRSAVLAAQAHARRAVEAATTESLPGLATSFHQINPANLDKLVGFLADGSPVRTLFAGLPGESGAALEAALIQGVGTGRGVGWMLARSNAALGIPRWRAETIIRTESLRAYRETTRQTYVANSDVLGGWTWHASLDARACAACIVMDGTEHGVNDTLDGHPRCRCAMVPRTKTWDEVTGMVTGLDDTRPPVRSGQEWLAGQPEAVQRHVMGRVKYDAYRRGDINLGDLVARTHDGRYGTMRRERSLAEIIDNRNANPLPSIPEPTTVAPTPVVQPVQPAVQVPAKPAPAKRARKQPAAPVVREPSDAELILELKINRSMDAIKRAEAQGDRQAFIALERKVLVENRRKLDALTAALNRGGGTVPEGLAVGRLPRRMTDMFPDRQAELDWDIKAANPGFARHDFQYKVNCVHVANTMELRARGYEVSASPLPKVMGSKGRSSNEALGRWLNPDGTRRFLLPHTPAALRKEVMSWPPGARGWVSLQWKGRGSGGHIFNVERTADGLRFIDGQNGDADVAGYLSRAQAKGIFLARVDDLVPTDSVLEFVLER